MRNKINWRDFYAESPFKINRVHTCDIVGIKGKMMFDLPYNPGDKAYLSVIVTVVRKNQKIADSILASPYGILQITNTAHIIIDTDARKWSYVSNHRVVNLPPRYRFTTIDREFIYNAAPEFIQKLREGQ